MFSRMTDFCVSRIWGSHGSEYEDCCLLGCRPCNLVEVYQRFRGPCCLHHQGEFLCVCGFCLLSATFPLVKAVAAHLSYCKFHKLPILMKEVSHSPLRNMLLNCFPSLLYFVTDNEQWCHWSRPISGMVLECETDSREFQVGRRGRSSQNSACMKAFTG
jgi:hypothetical protein